MFPLDQPVDDATSTRKQQETPRISPSTWMKPSFQAECLSYPTAPIHLVSPLSSSSPPLAVQQPPPSSMPRRSVARPPSFAPSTSPSSTTSLYSRKRPCLARLSPGGSSLPAFEAPPLAYAAPLTLSTTRRVSPPPLTPRTTTRASTERIGLAIAPPGRVPSSSTPVDLPISFRTTPSRNLPFRLAPPGKDRELGAGRSGSPGTSSSIPLSRIPSGSGLCTNVGSPRPSKPSPARSMKEVATTPGRIRPPPAVVPFPLGSGGRDSLHAAPVSTRLPVVLGATDVSGKRSSKNSPLRSPIEVTNKKRTESAMQPGLIPLGAIAGRTDRLFAVPGFSDGGGREDLLAGMMEGDGSPKKKRAGSTPLATTASLLLASQATSLTRFYNSSLATTGWAPEKKTTLAPADVRLRVLEVAKQEDLIRMRCALLLSSAMEEENGEGLVSTDEEEGELQEGTVFLRHRVAVAGQQQTGRNNIQVGMVVLGFRPWLEVQIMEERVLLLDQWRTAVA